MREFKVGDRVVCVEGGSGVVEGYCYTVTKTKDNPSLHSRNKYWVYTKGREDGNWQWRFRHIYVLPQNIRVL